MIRSDVMLRICFTVMMLISVAIPPAHGQDSLRIAPDTAIVSSFGTWTLSFLPGTPVHAGDIVRVQLPRLWQRMQTTTPSADGFVSAHSQKTGVTVAIDTSNSSEAIDGYGGLVNMVTVQVQGESLTAGEGLSIVLGEKGGGSRGLRPNFDAVTQYIVVEVVRAGIPERSSVGINVQPRPAKSLRIVAPTSMIPGEWGWLRVAAIDSLGNPDRKYSGSITVRSSDPTSTGPPIHTITPADSGIATLTYRAGTGRVQRLTVADDNGLTGESNPVVCDSAAKERVFWGDPHTHSILSNHGYGTPDRLFWYAENVSMLDWVAYTEHGYLEETPFRSSLPAGNRHNHPGRFVTLNGCEWTSPLVDGENAYGHICFYFPTDYPPFLSSEIYRTPEAITRALKSARAIAHVAHPVHRFFYDWGGFDSSIARNAEVIGVDYQTFEFRRLSDSLLRGEPLTAALRENRIFGFVGGSDNHYARPGMISPNGTSGLTAVVADELTRPAIFSALYNRKTYATSGARIFLDVSVNGHPMGSVNEGADTVIHQVVLDIKAAGTAPIDSVIVMKNGEVFSVAIPESTDIKSTIEDNNVALPVFYYVRIVQKDKHRAWSSPIWFTHRQPEDTTHRPPVVPAGFHLSEGYPNPFNPTITFVVTSESPIQISASIYDIYGRLVKDIARDVSFSGSTNIRWDALDMMERRVASGIYFFRVLAKNRTLISKCMLLR